MSFEPFGKLTRFSHDWTITEKIDGSNAQVYIASIAEQAALSPEPLPSGAVGIVDGDLLIYAGSRNRMLGLGKQNDHMGFAQFVSDRAGDFARSLGTGRHFGEWYGSGIQRGYGLEKGEKRFALFNPRWKGVELPDKVEVVPVLFQGYLHSTDQFEEAMAGLKNWGSLAVPGYLDPEGIVMYHGPSKTLFKKTFEYDEQGKWAENQARRQTS